MRRRYVLAPEAAMDLVQIWCYIKKESSVETADRVESAIRTVSFSQPRDQALVRKDLTDEAVTFFPVYSYLIVYRPDTKPLHVVAIQQGRRDVQQIRKARL
jgi:plasmid stabilization system protein ParE